MPPGGAAFTAASVKAAALARLREWSNGSVGAELLM